MTLQSIFQLGTFSPGSDNKEVFNPNILQCNLLRFRMVTNCSDNGSLPTTDPKTDIIEVLLATDETPRLLTEWYQMNTKQSGQVQIEAILPGSAETVVRTINFHDAHCFGIVAEFHQDKSRTLALQITAEKIEVDGEIFTR